MSDQTPDFMLEEYKQIANGYQDLHAQHNELVKFYLTLVAFPASLLTIAIQLLDIESIASSTIISDLKDFGFPVLLGFLTALCFVGLGVVAALTATRADALLYVRTINCVRRYFVENDPKGNLKRYLVMPDFDKIPPFWEGWRKRSFWNVTIVAILNSAIFFATFLSWLIFFDKSILWMAFTGCILWFVIQHGIHKILLIREEEKYNVKFPDPHPIERRIGVDLDGVLNDLAGGVIKVAQSKYGLKINRKDITSPRLQKCTSLSSAQVKEIFTKTDIFRSTKPIVGANKALKQLHNKGWIVYVLTDRFWGKKDWSIANSWLEEHRFKWDHLNLIQAHEKADYAKAHKISIFVEDNHETAVALSKVCDKVYLLDKPYNKRKLPKSVIRVSDWKNIIKNM